MPSATLLLPEQQRLSGRPLSASLARALGQADRERSQVGAKAQLLRHFDLAPAHWPVAALTRQADMGDAADALWLRADPAHIVPDMHGARLMAHGTAMALEHADAQALLPALQPLFDEAGLLLDAPRPGRWYLRLPEQSTLADFADPDLVLGDDLFAHLPEGQEGRRWRALLTEAQIILHQHPLNRDRIAQGKPTVNSLWFWGGGRLPHAVVTPFRHIRSHDALLQALGLAAGCTLQAGSETPGDVLIDLRHLRSRDSFAEEALRPLLQAIRQRELDALTLDFEDGQRYRLLRSQRWRFWRHASSLDQA